MVFDDPHFDNLMNSNLIEMIFNVNLYQYQNTV